MLRAASLAGAHACAERTRRCERRSRPCSNTRWPRARRRAIQLAVRDAPAGAVVVEIAAPEASGLGAIAVARLDALLDTTLRDLRGDFSLVLAGALAEAVGGAVTVASSPDSGLVLALHLAVA